MSSTIKGIMRFLACLALFVPTVHIAWAGDPPESVTLGTLAKLYEPVEFDHAMHVDITEGDCAKCHHHTTGTPIHNPTCLPCHKKSGAYKVVSCKGCHPAKRFGARYIKGMEKNALLYHIDKPGLKGAYHLNCLTCHKENDAPSGCQDCHSRTDAGDRFFHSGKYEPTDVAPRYGHYGLHSHE